jgi:broad specificity phosphatase PhoE
MSRAGVRVLFVRHAEIPSHRGDLALTATGVREAEAVGEMLAGEAGEGEHVSFLHAPTLRTRQTAGAIRTGMARTLDGRAGVVLDEPRLDHAIRNPDLYVAGVRVEMVSSVDALAAQLSADSPGELGRHPFFARFWAAEDRIGVWLRDPDPPGERADDVARRLFTFARSLLDVPGERSRRVVAVTHSGPLRAILARYVLARDPGEPGYLAAVELHLAPDGAVAWRVRETARPGAQPAGRSPTQ